MSADVAHSSLPDTNLFSLPDELLEIILSKSGLLFTDLIHVSESCRRLRNISFSPSVCEYFAKSRWSKWNQKLLGPVLDWYQIYKARHKLELQIHYQLIKLNENYFDEDLLASQVFQPITDVLKNDDYNIARETLCEYLTNILADTSQTNLTLKYYGKIVFNKVYLKARMKELIQTDDDKIILEEGAVIISSWLTPQLRIVNEDSIYKRLDSIASVIQKFLVDSDDHLLKKNSTISNGYVTDHYYCNKVLGAINKVLYDDMGFHGNRHDYYDDLNSFIDQVLNRKTGIPISLCIIYLAIARRLRVKLDPIGFPGHFLLRLKTSITGVDGSNVTNEVFIDTFNGGKLLSQEEAMVLSPHLSSSNMEYLQPIKNRQVLTRMVRNLTNIYQNNFGRRNILTTLINSLHLTMLLCPEDEDNHSFLTRLYYHFRIYDEEVIESAVEKEKNGIFELNPRHVDIIRRMKELKDESRKHELRVKRRPPDVNLPTHVLYRIGMMMQHRRYGYKCVIYGWDYECRMSHAWVTQMGVDMLPDGTKQPFYNVLVDDGSERYAAQENLEPLTDNFEPCPHPEVGKYFHSFDGTSYLPNDQLLIRYPNY